MSIWQKLSKPIMALAPMEDVTDTVFRQVLCSIGKPDLFFTEFTNVDGLFSPGYEQVVARLKFSSVEKPIIAQVWGVNPENYRKVGKLVSEMGFDGIDINMGCPIKKIIKTGGCSALIKNPTLAKEIYLAAKEGSCGLPVSIKTRIGFRGIETEEWIGYILGLKPDALTVHGRTVLEQSKVPCHWEEIAKAVRLRDSISPSTVILGNGDVKSVKQGIEYCGTFGVDGVMIGRGIFENPWLFGDKVEVLHSQEEKLALLMMHVTLFDNTRGEDTNFNVLKKFFKMYINGFSGAAQLRDEMMKLRSAQETLDYITRI
ncbi:MAG: tRNA-dihydrouridine synthase [candidate division WS6 bacterium GW2011_GWF2_39_15]|uniref:tRNA-dihydrouridine synthase n=1 Tax=candidate division WS6 bacterium GW2011_GWF2_39_15 TaxID=1619100 RepID=A0A0G0N062_9BACT|nr:MAG: tRNA-dihydrouridine synthase [candidate division WS6 bacterium GW2011_GWF2_39_15]